MISQKKENTESRLVGQAMATQIILIQYYAASREGASHSQEVNHDHPLDLPERRHRSLLSRQSLTMSIIPVPETPPLFIAIAGLIGAGAFLCLEDRLGASGSYLVFDTFLLFF